MLDIRLPSRLSNSEAHILANHDDVTANPGKRSEFVHHVFSRSSRSGIEPAWISSLRITKSNHKMNDRLSAKTTKPRVRLQRALNTLFNSSPSGDWHAADHELQPITSSAESSSIYGSLDLVSPRTFLFSGPSLHSSTDTNNTDFPEPSNCTRSFHLIRTDSYSVIESTADRQHGIFEPPVERDVPRSLSLVLLSGTTTPSHSVDRNIFKAPNEGHRSSTAITLSSDYSFCFETPRSLHSNTVIMQSVVPYLDLASRKSLRLTCHEYYDTVDRMAPLNFPPAFRIPTEILQQIYHNLSPKDFNAARHTCRDWMRASMSKKLLVTMITRGGWRRNLKPGYNNIDNAEWTLSRLLSRECALSFEWTGNGLDAQPAAFTESSQTDFQEFSRGIACSDRNFFNELIFTASPCGLFLLVARDTLINLYHFENRSLVLVSIIQCPRKVLAMSIDASSGRKAVAALLEGRMGILTELKDAYHLEDESQLPLETVQVRACNRSYSIERTHDPRTHDQHFINPSWNLELRGRSDDATANSDSMHRALCSEDELLECGPMTIYRHLCSPDDPPRSVSICPQRRCVAFGCASGVDLHWIDAVAGTSLSRWFPLIAPSDYLHFLVPRPGLDSANKLRLISSSEHPRNRHTRKTFNDKSSAMPFWLHDHHPFNGRFNHSDHHHAVPLSDGHHVLFVDHDSNRLFLGCDASYAGPTTLLRKVLFIPPIHVDNEVPYIYTTGANLSQGVRVVVAFGDTIVLYSVPPDICQDSSPINENVSFPPRESEEDHWSNWWSEPPLVISSIGHDTHWPIAIRGTEIGELRGVSELAIQNDPDITIWAFSRLSQGKSWHLHNSIDPMTRAQHYVCEFGKVHEANKVDTARDVIMKYVTPVLAAIPDFQKPDGEVGFNVVEHYTYERIRKGLAVENDDELDYLDVRGCTDAWFEGNGDVVVVERT